MISRLTGQLSYANVIATIALFLALGGGAYAATSLPRNSVGSAQIRNGAVGSSEVRGGSLHVSDLSSAARTSLRGQQGATGMTGPAGAPAAAYFAAVGAGGQSVRGDSNFVSHTDGGSGRYTVGFARDVSSCVYTASLGTTNMSAPPLGFVTVSNDSAGRVTVQTSDTAGNPKDLPFHLIVAC